MRGFLYSLVVFLAGMAPVRAENNQLADIWEAMRFDEFVEILSNEGTAEADSLEEALFPGRGGAAWHDELSRVYDTDTMEQGLRRALDLALEHREISEAIQFYRGPLGQKAIELELEAREDLLDGDVEAASHQLVETMTEQNDPRLQLIADYSDVNGLVDNNVAGAMNGNFAFMSALADAGQGPFGDDPSGILSEIWSQEAAIRTETEVWVMSYFALAYQPLSDAELIELTEFSATPAGQRLNAALFVSFDQFFAEIARELAVAAVVFMKGEQL